MTQPQFLNDREVNAIVERAGYDPATRRDLAGYLHHAELISRLAGAEPGPRMSEEYLDDFRTKYRISS
jgi:hypothetical protein